MSKRRIRFTKLDMAKYISHLDLLRCFTRTIGRAELPAVFTEGFNPHMKMTFALPLAVGVTSLCESVDIVFEDTVADEEIKTALNLNLPPDIRVISVGDICDNASDIAAAEYNVCLKSKKSFSEKDISDFFEKTEVIVMKKTKKKVEKPINIMEYIRAAEVISVGKEEEDDVFKAKLRLVLDAGGERNLKPDAVVGAFCKENPNVIPEDADIERTRIFCEDKTDIGPEPLLHEFA